MEESKKVFSAGIWKVREGHEDDFVALWAEFATWTARNVPGSKNVRLLQDDADPQLFISIGPWDGIDQISNWRQRAEFGTFLDSARELCERIEPHTMRQIAKVKGKKDMAA